MEIKTYIYISRYYWRVGESCAVTVRTIEKEEKIANEKYFYCV